MIDPLPDVIRRLLVAFFGLLLVAGGLVVGIHVVGLMAPIVLTLPGLTLVLNLADLTFMQMLGWATVSVWMVVVGLLLVGLGVMSATRQGRRIVLSRTALNGQYGGGRVTLAERSLVDLAAYVAERVDGVREARPVVRLRRKGWHVVCPITVAPEAALPDVAARLKTALHDAIERHTGLPVTRVDIEAQLPAQDARKRLA
ncbi:MAG: hypothetical protein KatS3mg042_1655 [Rhodothermaceae bacterium]|nr:MAG: hypothetical protein KatS3mg042_1655 [Rhodothermaceae bacterium]